MVPRVKSEHFVTLRSHHFFHWFIWGLVSTEPMRKMRSGEKSNASACVISLCVPRVSSLRQFREGGDHPLLFASPTSELMNHSTAINPVFSHLELAISFRWTS